MAKMDFKAVIDLVKYTLTLGAACFAYTLEKLVPAPSDGAKWFVLVLLSLFVFSVLGGIFIFSAATAALHDEERAEGQQPLIKKASYIDRSPAKASERGQAIGSRQRARSDCLAVAEPAQLSEACPVARASMTSSARCIITC
jgi:hypothetical protein